MKNLKKEIRRLLSLILTVAVIVSSGSSEVLTVWAAQINEDSIEADLPEGSENGQSESQSAVQTKIERTEPEVEESGLTEKQTILETTGSTEEKPFEDAEKNTVTQDAGSSETEIWELPESELFETESYEISETNGIANVEESSTAEPESTVTDTDIVAIRFSAEYASIKDSDGNIIASELFVMKGTKNAVTFTVEPLEGYVVKCVEPDSQDATIVVQKGTSADQYIITPQDIKDGYVKDECIHIETVPMESDRVDIFYDFPFELDRVEDVIVANGDVWRDGSPDNITLSNKYDTCVYVKVGKTQGPQMWVPEISVTCLKEDGIAYTETLSYQRDTNFMNAKERELLQQGYYIFHLGKLYDAMNIQIILNECYEVRFVTTGFPGNVRIFNYVPNGHDTQGNIKWSKEEIKDAIVAKYNCSIFLQIAWEDTPEHTYQRCKIEALSDTKANITNTTKDGIEGEIQEVCIYGKTTIEFTLKPHTISLNYFMDDLTDISAGKGAKLSEDKRFLEVYGGEQVSFDFSLMDGLKPDSVIDYSGARWSIHEHGGRYTITLDDMDMLYNIEDIHITVSDLQERYSLSDPQVECQIKDLKLKNENVYTGEAIEVENMTITARSPKFGYARIYLYMDEDFTVSYVDNINAGEAWIIVTMMPDSHDFRGSYAEPFIIDKAQAPQGQDKTLQIETGNRQYTHQINLSELFRIKQPNGDEIIPLGYNLSDSDYNKGEVLVQNEEPVLEGNILTFTIREDADKNASMAEFWVYAFFENYQDCCLHISIQAVQKQKITLGGTVTVPDKEYDGKCVSPNADGLQILSIEGSNKTVSEETLNEIQKTLDYRYTGVGSTVYFSDNAPTDAGTYKVEAKVFEKNPDFKSEYMEVGTFRINPRNVNVIADDVKLYLGDTIPAQYSYHTDRLVEGDIISTESFVTCGIQNTDALTEYPISVDTAAVKIADSTGKDVTANYLIVGQQGKLTVCEPEQGSYCVTYTRTDPLDSLNTQKDMIHSGNEAGTLLKKPIDPQTDGYVFLGWYTDETLGREWNFETDIIQSDLTLYAGWSKNAVESGGMAICVQDILPQTYTGKAIKPAIVVYASDGKTRLKSKTDYMITYRNNVNADTAVFPDNVPQGGIGETIDDTTHGFNSDLPYVIIQGRGNYVGTVYVNFHIRPADIAAAQTDASEYILKYTDQFEEKSGRYASFITQFKYKKKGLRYNKDYLLVIEKTGGKDSENAAVPLDAKGQFPLTAGMYRVRISGKGNFTGEIMKTLYIADKMQLLKNAKVTCKAVISNVTKEQLKVGIQPEDLVVMMNGIELTKDSYTVECTNNYAIGTAIVTVQAKGKDYVGSKCVTFQIKGTDFKEDTIQMSGWRDELPYAGKPLTQNSVTLRTNDGRNMIYGADYTVSYKNNIKTGIAEMTFTANPVSGYSGSFCKKFKITPINLDTAVKEGTILINGAEKTDSGWKLTKSVPYQKGGVSPVDKISLQYTISNTVLKFGKGRDYTVKYTNNKAVSNGTAYMTLQGTGNFTGNIDICFDIAKASLFQIYQQGRVTVTTASIKVPYSFIYKKYYKEDGGLYEEWTEEQLKDPNRKFEPAVTIKDGKASLKKDVDFTVEYIGNTRSELEGNDSLVIKIKGKGNYGADDDEIELNVTVNRRTLTNAKVEVTTYENAFTYTGEQILPEVAEVRYKTYNGYGKEDSDYYDPPEWETLKLGEDYRIAYTKNIVQGTGTIQIIGIGAYTGSASKSFKINSKEIYNKTPK